MKQSDIHAELHDFWGGYWHHRRDDLQEFADYAALTQHPEQALPPLTLLDMRAAIAHMGKGKAAGGDGWRGEELAWLDDGALHLLLKFMAR
eukprot:1493031-Amphidinium_carterae.1